MPKIDYTPFREMIVNYEVTSQKIAEVIGNGCTASAVRAARRRFLKPEECRKTNLRWRKKNKTKESQLQKIRYKKNCQFAVNNRSEYTEKENDLILNSDHTAAELAKILGRSRGAIYTQQHRLRQKSL